ncbi:MAG TPA: 50S ribosomal protein L22 [Rhabdochlamydiaceae bacterium]|nr:50S ribosomal protein L22 [Rhabdochlamydiaceae bacterium]
MQNRKAMTKYLRIPPRKARLAADLIRGLKVEDAAIQLMYSQLKGGKLLKKTLDSAVANAETQLNIPRQKLVVKEVRVDCGPVLKRSKSKARGGMVAIMKRTSHFTVVVEPLEEDKEGK